jgi:hypothetical protein
MLNNPNKYVRKVISDAIGPTYPIFDMEVTGNQNPTEYVLMSTQSKAIDKANKCNYRWETYLLLDLVTIYNGAGNPGSRAKVDDMENVIMDLIKDVQIPGYEVVNRSYEFPDNLDNISSTQNVFRNFIRVILLLQ